ncbi:unnamed protein product [Dibothriocephalus latus]|uniref:Deoxynucleoside kinase domain-containing protein n=1 Tax=Dibothriocephalus latus TaxID=60516 RepID=A0A3P7LHL3_DIBLA|nr:unnamed protein product [Dibothriocephalus latus]
MACHTAARRALVALSLFLTYMFMVDFSKQISDDDLAVLDQFYEWARDLPSAKLDLIVYLRCPAEVCAERIRMRDRPGEQKAISMEYLQQLHDLYEKLFLAGRSDKCPVPVLVSLCAALAV